MFGPGMGGQVLARPAANLVGRMTHPRTGQSRGRLACVAGHGRQDALPDDRVAFGRDLLSQPLDGQSSQRPFLAQGDQVRRRPSPLGQVRERQPHQRREDGLMLRQHVVIDRLRQGAEAVGDKPLQGLRQPGAKILHSLKILPIQQPLDPLDRRLVQRLLREGLRRTAVLRRTAGGNALEVGRGFPCGAALVRRRRTGRPVPNTRPTLRPPSSA